MDATTLRVLRRHRSDDRAQSARVASPPAARSAGEARSTGRVSIDLTGAHVSQRAFLVGAAAERQVEATLEQLAGERVLFLHYRRHGTGACGGVIEHIAIAPSGVWVLDAHHYAGAKVRVWVTGGIVGPPEREQLMIRGDDRTDLVAALAWQEAAVRRKLGPYGVRVRALMCFLDASLPMFALPTIRGYAVLGARDTARRLQQGGPLGEDQRQQIWEMLSRALPAA
jgi:hypothetical protein